MCTLLLFSYVIFNMYLVSYTHPIVDETYPFQKTFKHRRE